MNQRRAFYPEQLNDARKTAARDLDWRYRAIYEFLQISPSYLAAHELATTGQAHLNVLPSDFGKVQATYARLGSVWQTSFYEWWFKRAQYEFNRTTEPALDIVGQLNSGERLSAADAMELNRRLLTSLSIKRDLDGLPGTIVVTIPLRGTAKKALKRLSGLLNRLQFDPDQFGSYNLVRSKVREPALVKCLQVVRRRASAPNRPIWQVAAQVKINPTRSGRNTVDDKHVLSAHTSRYTKRAYTLAENAARGSFPDETALPPDVATQSFDFAVLNRVYRQEIRFLEHEIKKTEIDSKRKQASRSPVR